MVDHTYTEDAPLLSRTLTYILAGTLVATLVCMFVTSVPSWMSIVSAVVFAIIIVFVWLARLSVKVSSEGVEVRYLFRRRNYPADTILDKRCGELTAIRNYSNWNLKGVKHRAFTRIDDEYGVALKLKGKQVVVISSADHERMFENVPVEIVEETEEAARCPT